MKTYFSILLFFCAVGLSYGSSHAVNMCSDSVVKTRADTIKIGKTDRNSYYYKGYKPLTDAELEFLLKDAHNEQVDNYLTESKIEKSNSKILIGVFIVSLIVIGIVFINIFFSVIFSSFLGTTSGVAGKIVAMVLAGIYLYSLPVFAFAKKAKSNRLKRKAVERYNEIVKSGK
jgi:hypothetical protein